MVGYLQIYSWADYYINPYEFVIDVVELEEFDENYLQDITQENIPAMVLSQGCGVDKRQLILIKNLDNLTEYHKIATNFKIGPTECENCKYWIFLRNFGRKIDREISISIILNTNNFNFKELDQRVNPPNIIDEDMKLVN